MGFPSLVIRVSLSHSVHMLTPSGSDTSDSYFCVGTLSLGILSSYKPQCLHFSGSKHSFAANFHALVVEPWDMFQCFLK